MRSTRSPRFVIDLNFQNLFVHFGMAKSSTSVTPSCCNCIQLCISVPPSCSTRSHRQCQAIYIHGQFLENFLQNSSPAHSLHYLPGSPDRPPHRQPPPVAGLPRRQRDRLCRCRRSKSIAELGYGLDLCATPSSESQAHCFAMYLAMIEITLSSVITP